MVSAWDWHFKQKFASDAWKQGCVLCSRTDATRGQVTVSPTRPGEWALTWDCPNCGLYGVAPDVLLLLCNKQEDMNLSRAEMGALSGYIRNRQIRGAKPPLLCDKGCLSEKPVVDGIRKDGEWKVVLLDDVLDRLKSRSIIDRLDDILVNLCLLSGRWPTLLDEKDIAPSLFYAANFGEVYVLRDELVGRGHAEIVERKGPFSSSYGLRGPSKLGLRITAKGWERYEEICRARPKTADAPSEKVYDVALSFAGEDRPFVESVAGVLQKNGIDIFYAEFERAKLWGKDLAVYLTDLYSKRARYCVVFVSAHYVKKPFPNLEWRSALAKAISEKQEYILPVRLDDSDLPGLLPTVCFVDGKKEGPSGVANLIVDKVRSTQA